MASKPSLSLVGNDNVLALGDYEQNIIYMTFKRNYRLHLGESIARRSAPITWVERLLLLVLANFRNVMIVWGDTAEVTCSSISHNLIQSCSIQDDQFPLFPSPTSHVRTLVADELHKKDLLTVDWLLDVKLLGRA